MQQSDNVVKQVLRDYKTTKEVLFHISLDNDIFEHYGFSKSVFIFKL